MRKFINTRLQDFINESKSVNKAAILFTDIKGSSELWSIDEDKMLETLSKLDKMIQQYVKTNNGMVVKTIGDSFMCSYEMKDGLYDAIKTAVSIQKSLIESPISLGSENIKLRIGICYGEVYITETNIQNTKLKDYLGNCVNSSSRLESKVSDINGLAFAFLTDINNEKQILKYLEDNDINIEVIEYDNKCDKNKERKRSARLLTDLQINSCKDPDELKGIKPLRVYKCNMKQ